MKSGFTLVELIVTLTVIAILASVAGPSMFAMIQDNRLTGQTNDFVSDLNKTRTEAITKRPGQQVTMCRVTPGTQCTEDIVSSGSPCENACDTDAGNGWEDGWVIFRDDQTLADTTTEQIDAGETIIKVHTALPASFVLTSNNLTSNNFITFSETGESNAGTTFILHMTSHEKIAGKWMRRCIVLSPIGRTRTFNPNYVADYCDSDKCDGDPKCPLS